MMNNNFVSPATFIDVEFTPEQPAVTADFVGSAGINLDFFNGENSISTGAIEVSAPTTEKRKPGRPKKNKDEVKTKQVSNGEVIVVADDNTSENLPMSLSNEPFSSGFELSTGILKQSVGQLDELGFLVMDELNKVKNSQMKSKYVVLPQLASSLSTIISTKVTAVREINKTVKDCYDLEMKRMKETVKEQSAVTDEQYVMDAYNAFISAPVGAQPFIAPPSMINSTTLAGGIVRSELGSSTDAMYDQYVQSMTPEQNMMNYEHNPNIKTVVVYDAANPMNRYFDVVDITTGQSIPNVPRPDAMFLENTSIDEYNGVARNSDLDINYPLVVLNSDTKLNHY